MSKQRSREDAQIAALLRTAKSALGLSVTFLSRMDGTTQRLEIVETSLPFGSVIFQEGYETPQSTTLCQAVRDGKLPAVTANLKDYPDAMKLPAARFPRIRSYVSVPVILSDGTLYGTFCGAGLSSDRGLGKRDQALMEVLAQAAAVILEPTEVDRIRTAEIESRLVPLIDAGGPLVVLQPIVELASGVRIGSEALSRFPHSWDMAPDTCFAETHSVGRGHDLELQALAGAAAHLHNVTGYVAMNVSQQR